MGTFSRAGLHSHTDEMGSDSFFAHNGHTRTPRLVQWMVTGRCPLVCAHCSSAPAANLPDPDLKQAASLAEQVARLGVDELLLTGGEPMAREDLADILDILRDHRIRWSLNTALFPDRKTRRAMEQWPPAFVAVSLDGPASVHDRFRGRVGLFDQALQAIDFYSDLAEDGVAVGTTVTRRNVDRLAETFALVLSSGATRWGLHLVVPEGRAGLQPDLALSTPQLSDLLRFVSDKRNHFPVDLADEIGFCGSFEPLVRDTPFYCGAGRSGCVVLPSGEVVPCTTTDRTTSAGNVFDQGLEAIWRNGFRELRNWTPKEDCERCKYAPACQGGCWLQRRHGSHCFRKAWERPLPARAAAWVLGLSLALGAGSSTEPAHARPSYRDSLPDKDASKMEQVQQAIILWYASQVGGHRSPQGSAALDKLRSLGKDPAAAYVLDFIQRKRPASLTRRAASIESALGSDQRSLCLLGMAWRDLAEWILDGPVPTERSQSQQKLLIRTLGHLGTTAEAWRQKVFEDKLDPFLRRPEAYRWFFMSKAGPPPWLRMHRGLSAKRGWTQPDLSKEFLEAHPYAEIMEISIELAPTCRPEVHRAGAKVPFNGRMGVFDVLTIQAKGTCGPQGLTVRASGKAFTAEVPTQVELTYPDILRLVYEQNRKAIDSLSSRLWSHGRYRDGLALLLPGLRERQKKALAEKQTARTKDALRKIHWQLTDIYLF